MHKYWLYTKAYAAFFVTTLFSPLALLWLFSGYLISALVRTYEDACFVVIDARRILDKHLNYIKYLS